MIEVHQRFEVASGTRTVWGVLSNPHEVVGCVPGASLGQELDDGAFEATLAVSFGPTRVAFRATVALTLDEAAMEGHLTARGKDARGGAQVRATMAFRVREQPSTGGSEVAIDGGVEIAGRLASLIEGGANRVVQRMSSQFAEALAERCAQVNAA